jgi:hypothetical protein
MNPCESLLIIINPNDFPYDFPHKIESDPKRSGRLVARCPHEAP